VRSAFTSDAEVVLTAFLVGVDFVLAAFFGVKLFAGIFSPLS